MEYDEAIDWLYGTQLFGIKLGLDGTKRLFEKLNLYDALKGREIFHVAGTNGKGSTCAMIDSICRASGKRCGLFTSPHLICFRERILVDGSMIPESETANILTQLRNEVINWETHPTFFELTAALAVKYFCQEDVDVLVMETGMGGRLDATNVLPTSVSVITSVALDHQEWLGDDLETIASEKAGIIKSGVPVIVSPCQNETVLRVLDQAAAELNAPLLRISTADLEWRQELGLRGPHQRLNAALAVEAVTTLWPNLSESSIERGLREVIWPGRFDLRAGNIVIDGAHNPAAMEALVSTWIEEFGIEARAAVVFGAANSKDVPEIFSKLAPITQTFIFVELSAERGLKMTELESAFGESDVRDIPCLRASDVSTALELAKTADLPILVTGSLFLAGETLSLCDDRSSRFEPSEQ